MTNSTAENISDGLAIQIDEVMHKIFDDSNFQFDLKEGIVRSPADKRVIYLSEDLLRGLYRALESETGQAWAVILKNCGHFWGKHVGTNLDKQLQNIQQKNMGELQLQEYLSLVENYFAQNGWGVLHLHMDYAQKQGVIQASLQNSIFVHALSHVENRVDFMIAGMLRALIERVSGAELDCVQICCERDSADKCGHFVISGRKRIDKLEAKVSGPGLSLQDALTILS